MTITSQELEICRHRLAMLAGCLALCLPICAWAQSPLPANIRPGEIWRDNRNEIIQAHGAGIIKTDGIYYWFGEDHTGHTSDQSFLNIHCYASKDLVHWTFQGNSLTRQDAPGDLGPDRAVERPKVIYNASTNMFVMYVHIDDTKYQEAKIGVATCARVDGQYTYRGSFQPLGHESRDMTLFQEDDGKAYLIFEDRKSGVRIARLSSDYLTVEQELALIPHAYESPAMVKVSGVYYLLGSHLTEWNLNSNEYATADSPSGPWSSFQPAAPPETKTYNSQTAYILPVTGSRETSYIYLGDRWKGNYLKDSRYVWMPLRIDPPHRTLRLTPDAPWTIDATTGFCSLPITASAP